MVPGYLQELKPEKKQKQGRYVFRNKNDLGINKLENNKVSEILFALCRFTLEQIRWKNKNNYKIWAF